MQPSGAAAELLLNHRDSVDGRFKQLQLGGRVSAKSLGHPVDQNPDPFGLSLPAKITKLAFPRFREGTGVGQAVPQRSDPLFSRLLTHREVGRVH